MSPVTRQSALRPLVAVLCCGGASAGRPLQCVPDRYLVPLVAAGASAVLVPVMADAVDALTIAARCDALLLTGSISNVAPGRYGSDSPGIDPDHGRDEVAMSVAGAMIGAGRPVLGICRGMQELNVLHGGTLEALDDRHGMHMSGEWECPKVFDHSHDVSVTGPVLSAIARCGTMPVASVHRQGVGRIGTGLVVEARAPDGLVEAFSAGSVMGVQWHPEVLRSPVDRMLFERLVSAA